MGADKDTREGMVTSVKYLLNSLERAMGMRDAMSVFGEAEEEKKKGRQWQGRDCVGVQMSMSMWCTICHMLKLKELTPLLNCRRLLKAVRCHHRSFSFVPPPSSMSSFVPPSAISRKRGPNFLASALVRNPSRCFVKRSAVLFFVSTRLTDRRLSRIHCCVNKASYFDVFESAWSPAL